jgi:hypothetical protein
VNARIGRWVLELSEYRFTIVHRSNLQMRHVDALSRNLPISEHGVHLAVIDEIDWLLSIQQSDDSIQHIKQLLESGDRDGNSNLFCNYALKGGKVYKILVTLDLIKLTIWYRVNIGLRACACLFENTSIIVWIVYILNYPEGNDQVVFILYLKLPHGAYRPSGSFRENKSGQYPIISHYRRFHQIYTTLSSQEY